MIVSVLVCYAIKRILCTVLKIFQEIKFNNISSDILIFYIFQFSNHKEIIRNSSRISVQGCILCNISYNNKYWKKKASRIEIHWYVFKIYVNNLGNIVQHEIKTVGKL